MVMILLFIVMYSFLCLACSVVATDFKTKWWEALVLSIFFTPWIAMICIYISGKKGTP